MKFSTSKGLLSFVAIGWTLNPARGFSTHIHRKTCSTTVLKQASRVSESIADRAAVCEATSALKNNAASPSYLDDGFVFGLEGSGLERPKGRTAQVVVEGDNLETQWWQILLVGVTFVGHGCFLINSFSRMFEINSSDLLITSGESFLLLVLSWLLADIGSGILHWSVDNYGNGRTPIMGGVIAAFQGHHSAPWTITERGFCNNVYKLCLPFGIPTLAVIDFLGNSPFMTMFFAYFCALEILSQELHKWSHMTKGEVPEWVNVLQGIGLIIGRTPHAKHHIAPYDGNYCIVSGVWNTWLDESGFFRRLERIIYDNNGVESNAWKLDGELKARTMKGDYTMVSVQK